MQNNDKHDCTNCKYGHYNNIWDTFLCNNLECKEWELWEPKEEEKKDAE